MSAELAVDIKARDNRYHLKTKTGRKSSVHKYSNELLEVITSMKKDQPYVLENI